MTLESDFENLEKAHRELLVAYTTLTEKKVKSKAPEARKALMDIINISKDMRKSVRISKTRSKHRYVRKKIKASQFVSVFF